MPFVDRERVLARFRTDGANSSHFVWLLAGVQAYECANGWLFGYRQLGEVTLIALEPLIPSGPGAPKAYPKAYDEAQLSAFRSAWDEFARAVHVRVAAFVAVYEPFVALLRRSGFACVRVGQEPWVDLGDCIPTGNAGKGVRNARNQALAAGLTVEEWKADDIEADAAKKHVLREIFDEWRGQRLVELGGFMNVTAPFRFMHERRYFVLRSPRRVESFLVATPVPGREGYFLEDLVQRRTVPRGAGELITLEAMVALSAGGAKTASLGVVSLTSIDPHGGDDLPGLVRFVMVQAPALLSQVYNFSGMEIYRKRFKPRVWEAIHLGVKDCRAPLERDAPADALPGTGAWLRALVALLIAFQPRLRLTPGWLLGAIGSRLRRTPFTVLFAAVSLALFARINRFHNLPDWALAKYGFFANAHWSEWLLRTTVSDFLYFDVHHFLACAVPLIGLVYWAERTHKRAFVVTLILGNIVFDDVLNYWVLIKPFEHFQPSMFRHLVAYKDVGGSLILSTLVGMQLCQFRLIREPLVAIITLAFVLGFAFTSVRLEWLIMNLNHAIFFVIGFLIGKGEFEYKRFKSRRASKRKPPVDSRAVLASGVRKGSPKERRIAAGRGRRAGDKADDPTS
ncbi:MAG: DUF2156 domain-containing protein [Deltaproteobacteria bacterium]|nr:DUF2156 domain-containing protein [Deltaproteobacteria bacterium]